MTIAAHPESLAVLADAQPLYIAPRADTRVDLDGPALCVRREECAEQYFPLQRICRVYTADHVDWTSEALLACARRGIGVLFVDDDGAVIARLLGRPGELYQRLMEFLLLPQAMGMYHHWLGAYDGRCAYWAGAKLGVPVHARDPRRCREAIKRLASGYAGDQGGERSGQWLRAVAYAWMQAHLQDLGFGADNELARSGEPSLVRDLTRLFVWYLEPRRCAAAPSPVPSIAGSFTRPDMAINAKRNHLVCYDIADPRRLTQVHRTVKQWGMPLQYSVFLVPATPNGIAALMGELAGTIDFREDDIRIYPLPNRLETAILGRQGLPQGISLTDASEIGRVLEILAAPPKPR